MSKLRRIHALPIPAIDRAKVTGTKPRLLWIAPTSLLVDEIYQRDLSKRSMQLIRKMVSEFAWNRLKPPIVVAAGRNEFHIVDGQHTAIAAATLEIPEIPVFVVEAEKIDERARAFVGHNTDRIVVSPIDIFRALLGAGDPDAVDVDNVCKRAGVRIRTMNQGSLVAEGDTMAIGMIRRLVAKRGVVKARQVLECLVKAKRAPISAAEISAVEQIICGTDRAPSLETVVAAIRIEGTAGIAAAFAKAKRDREPAWRCLLARYAKHLDAAA